MEGKTLHLEDCIPVALVADGAVLARDGALVLAGGRPRGTLYAVYHYLEDVAGVRWLTPATDHVPTHGKLPLPKGDMRGKPAMPYREIYDELLKQVPDYQGNSYYRRDKKMQILIWLLRCCPPMATIALRWYIKKNNIIT